MSEPVRTVEAQVATSVIEVSVVLPCLNEAETLKTCIDKAEASLAALGVVGEVVVADNGSDDGSQDIARSCGARVVDVPIRGYGAALQAGIEGAFGRYVIMADADDSYALEDLGPFVQSLREGADLVMGNRFAGGIAPGAMPALHRYLGNPVLSFVGRRLFNIPVHDFHCGMRGFRRDRVQELGLRTLGMEFASEMVVRAALNAYDIREVPTTLRPDGRSRPPHLRTWLDGWRHLRFLLALSPRWALYYPAIALVAIGTVVFLWLLTGIQKIGAVSLDLHTLVAAATAIIVGVQLGGLALVSRAYCGHLGLLPTSSRIDRLLERFTLERGLLVGFAAVLVGIGCFVVAVVRWEATDFGALEIGQSMRIVMSGMVLIVTGMQVAAVSFMLSLVRVGEM
jgi:glycosyltransferase involved in cell wall biosynthesis